jgi:hypothetical protein
MFPYGCAALVVVLFAAGMVFFWPYWRRKRDAAQIARARQRFRQRREWLEADFLKLAARRGKPRGRRWAGCEFEDDFAFARDRHTGQLRALVGVAVRFQPVGGAGIEPSEAAGNLRAATAVFHYDGADWRTDGRAVFNLNPAQTIKRFQHELEVVD